MPTLNDDIPAIGAVDYFDFTVTTAGDVRIDATTPSSGLDTFIYLFRKNADGTLGTALAFDDDGGVAGFDSRIDVTLATGDYVVVVSHFDFTEGDARDGTNNAPPGSFPTGSYTLDVNGVGGTPATIGTLAASALVVDTTPPTIVSAVFDDPAITEADDTNTVTLTITFSEDMDPGTAPTVSTNAGTTLTSGIGSWTSATTYEIAYTVADADMELADVLIDVSGGTDTNTNTMVAVTALGTGTSVDTLLGTPPAPNLRTSSDSGAFSNDDITNDDTPSFRINLTPDMQAGDTVEIFEGGNLLGTAVLSATNVTNTFVNITSSTLSPDGVYNISTQFTDVAGNTASSASTLAVTIDTAPPTITGANITVTGGTGTGGANADFIVGDSIMISWNALADGNTDVSSATVDLSAYGLTAAETLVEGPPGTWTFTAALPLAQDTTGNIITITAVDVAGNSSGPINNNDTFDVDTTMAAAAAPDLQAASDSAGASTSDDITNINTPTFDVTIPAAGLEPDDLVELIDTSNGNAVVGTYTIVGGEGPTVAITSSLLTDGAHNIAVRFTDLSGNSSLSSALPVTIDTMMPAAPTVVLTNDTGSSGTDMITMDGTLTVTPAEAGGVIEYSIDGGTTYTSSFTAVEGPNTVLVRQVDDAGNESAATSLSFTLDTMMPAAPTVVLTNDTGSSGTDMITMDGTLTVTPAEAGGVIEYSIDGGTTYTSSFTAVEGPNTVLVRQVDDAGNESAATSLSFTLDTMMPAAPTVVLTNDTGSSGTDMITMDGTLTVTPAEAGGVIEYSIDGGTTYTSSFTAVEGPNTVLVRQVDDAGNESAATSLSFTLDTMMPAAPTVVLTNDTGSSGTDMITMDGTLTVTPAEAGGVIEYSIDGGTTYTSSFTAVEGPNTVLVRQVDDAGNESAATSLSFTLDTMMPAAPTVVLTNDTGSSGTDMITMDGTLTVTPAEAGGVIEYSIDGGTTYTSSFTAVEGPNTVLVRQVDDAGNESAATSLSFTLDTMMPAAPTVVLTNDTGSSGTDMITMDGTLTVTPAEAGGVIEYSIDGGTTYTSSFTAVEGPNTVLVRQVDDAGNESAATSLSFTLDTMMPAAPTVALENDTGVSGSDDLTNDPDVIVSGLETTATWEYSTDNGVNWTAGGPIDGSGDSTFALPGDGTYQVLTRQTDAAGNVSANSVLETYTLDTMAPVVTSADGDPNATTRDEYPEPNNLTPAGDVLEVLSNDDAGPGGLTYTFAAGSNLDGAFALVINGANTELQVADPTIFDFEDHVGGMLSVDIVATDDAGNTTTFTHTVTLNDLNDAPEVDQLTSDLTGGFIETDDTNDAVEVDTTLFSDTGSLNFSDDDVEDHNVSVTNISSTHPGGFVGTFLAGLAEVASDDGFGRIDWTFGQASSGGPGVPFTAAEIATVDALADGETIVQVFRVLINENDGGATTFQDVTVTITGTNDTPIITGGPDAEMLTEANTGLMATDSFMVSDVDTTDVVTASVTALAAPTGTGAGSIPATLTVTDLQNMMTVNAAVIANGANSGTITWAFDSGTEEFNFLAAGETLVLEYEITAQDDSGVTVSPNEDAATETVTITITGTNDDPVITSADLVGMVTEASSVAALTDTGTIEFDDADVTDTHATLDAFTGTTNAAGQLGSLSSTVTTATTAGTGGQITWNYSVDDADVQFLGATETIVETYTITLSDGNGGTVVQTVNVTIQGTNDAPVIFVDAGAGDSAAGAVTEGNAGNLMDSGTLTVEDVDVTDAVSVTPMGVTATGTLGSFAAASDATLQAMFTTTGDLDNTETSEQINWMFDSGATTFDYLAEGESLTIDYTIVVDDGTAQDTQIVQVIVTGTNDDPVISSGPATSGLLEDGPTVADDPTTVPVETGAFLTDTGTFAFTDLDWSDSHTASASFTSASSSAPSVSPGTQFGNLVASVSTQTDAMGQNGQVTWTYAVDNAAIQFLAAGETITEVYTVEVADSASPSGTHTETVTVTLTGANDAPTLGIEAFTITDGDELDNFALSLNDLDTTAASMFASIDGQLDGADVDASDMLTYSIVGQPVALDGSTSIMLMNGGTAYGLLTVQADGSYSFVPDLDAINALDETPAGDFVLSTMVQVSDGTAVTAAAFNITVDGNNDNPYFVDPLQFLGDITEYADNSLEENVDNHISSLSINFDDPELGDIHTTNITAFADTDTPALVDYIGTFTTGFPDTATGPGTGTVTFEFVVNDSVIDALGEGDTIIQKYSLQVLDDAGGMVTENIVITITGSNDAPVITAVNGSGQSITEDMSNVVTDATTMQTVSGDIMFDDADTNFVDPGGINGVSSSTAPADMHTVTATFASATLDGNSYTVTGSTGSFAFDTALANASNAVGNTVTWDYTINDTDFDYLREGEVLALTFDVNVVDDSGAANDTATTQITVNIVGTNDAPSITGATNPASIAEVVGDSSAQDIAAVMGTIAIDDADVGDTLTASVTGGATAVWSGGLTLPTSVAALIAAGNVSFDPLTSNGAAQTINWTYDPAASDLDFLGAGETLTLTYQAEVTDGLATSSTQNLVITITGTNDVPVANADTNTATEDAAAVTGDLSTNDIDLDANAVLTYTLDAPIDGLTVNSDGTYSFDPANAAYQHIAQGATQTVIANYTVTDDQSTTASSTLTIVVSGVNDAPVANPDVNTATEDGTLATGDVSVNDSDVDDGAVLTYTLDTPVDGLTLNTDGTYSFDPADAAYQYLQAGQMVTIIANYTVTDEFLATDMSTLSITITGTNDLPMVTSADLVGMVTEADSTAALTDTGTIEFDDVDVLDTHSTLDAFTMTTHPGGQLGTLSSSVTTATSGGIGGQVTWTYSVNDADVQFLAAGETITESYTITLDDGNGGTVDQIVEVTINGTNDAPVISAPDAPHTINDTVAADANLDASGMLAVTDVDATDTHTFSLVGVGTSLYGTLTVNTDGSYAFDANEAAIDALDFGDNVTVSYTVQVDDDNGGIDSTTIDFNLVGINDAPIANDDMTAGDQGEFLTFDVINGGTPGMVVDTDAEGHNLRIVSGSDVLDASSGEPLGGSATVTPVVNGVFFTDWGAEVTLQSDGNVFYNLTAGTGKYTTLALGETATDTFTYTISDDGSPNETATATVTVQITGINDDPIAAAIVGNVDEDGPTVTIMADFTDIDTIDTHTYSVNTSGTLGTVTNNNDGTFTYDPNGQFESLAVGETATDTFTYTVNDGNGGTDTAVATITIMGQNDAPVAVAVSGSADEDGPSVTVSANFTDVDASDTHTFSFDDAGTLGTVTAGTNPGDFDYDPNGQFEYLAAGETATDTFTYTVTDNNGASSTETVTITITGQNDAPVAVAVSASADEDGPVATVTAVFTDVDVNDTHTFSFDDTGTLGTVTNNNDGTFDYDPNGQFEALAAGETATDTFTYTVMDNNGASSTETATITIMGQNDAPVAVAVSGSADEDGPSVTVSANFTDVDASDTHTFSFDDAGTLGTVTAGTNPGDFDYDPNGQFEYLAAGETATDTFTYTVTDNNGASSTETVTITITGQNDAPVAVAVSASADEDGPVATVTAVFTDVDVNDTHTFSFDDTGTLGTVTNNNDGTFDYDPNGQFEALAAGETATDTFTYTVMDNNGASSTETATITIMGQNDAPVAVAVSGSADEDGPSVTVSANFTDVDASDTHTFSFDDAGTLGTVTAGTNPGDFDYDPNGQFEYLAAGETATDTFTYTVMDNNGASSTETVTITITGQNDAPVAVAVSASADEDGPVATVTAVFTDVDVNDTHTFSFDDTGTLGTVTNNNDGTFDYDPNGQFEALAAGETATDTFTYTVMDNNGASSTETATITIMGQNDAPVAVAVSGSADEDGPSVTVSANFTDVDASDTHTFSFDDAGTLGTVTAGTNPGDFDYDPNGQFEYLAAGETATDTFTYTVMDNNGASSTETVTITITGQNDAPVVAAVLTAAVDEDDSNFAINLLDGASDPDTSDSISVDAGSVMGLTAGLVLAGNTLNVDPSHADFQSLNAGEDLVLTVSYDIVDGNGGVTNQTATITITGTNDAAVISGDISGTVLEDAAIDAVGDLDHTDVDSADADDAWNTAVVTQGVYGTLTIAADGQWSYALDDANPTVDALNVGDSVTDMVTVATADGTQQVISITIDGANDAAVISGDVAGTATEDAGVAVTGTLTATDVDNTDDTFMATSGTAAYGSWAIDAAGLWTYTLDDANPAVDALNVGDSLSDSFDVMSEDGTIQTISITIDGANDAAVISGDVAGTATEDAGVAVTGTLTATDVDNTDDTFMATSGTAAYGSWAIDAAGLWTYTLDDANPTVDALNVGDSLSDSFDVMSEDGTIQTISITIDGANDAAVISGDVAGTATEDAGVAVTGTLTATDVDNTDDTFMATSGTAAYGSWAIDAAGLWTYTLDDANPAVDALNVGDSLSDSFDVMSEDGTIQTISITIDGANDAAVISGDVAGTATEDAGVAVTGTLTATDVDNTDDTFMATSGTAAYGSWAIDAAGLWTYTLDDANPTVDALNVGDSLSDSFDVMSEDGTIQTISITIDGANDAAVISGDVAGTATEDAGVAVTGTLTATDVDNTDDTFMATSGTAAYGSWAIDAAGLWTYTLDDANPAVDALNVGDSLSDSFDVMSEDGTIQTISITIDGANDAATITGDVAGDVVEDNIFTATGAVVVSDPEPGEDMAQAILAGTASDSGYGTIEVLSDGTWSYTLDNALSTVQNLAPGDTLIDTFTITSLDGSASETVTVTITGGVNPIVGTPNDDILVGTFDEDNITGLAGNDTIDGGTGDDVIDGGDGNDVIQSGGGLDIVDGGAGDDTIIWDTTNDDVNSGESYDGGADRDTLLTRSGNFTNGTFNLGTGLYSNGAFMVNIDNFENYDGTGNLNTSNETVIGSAGDNVLLLGRGDNIIDGGAGNDTINAGLGDDEVDGGTGDDTILGQLGEDIIDGGDGNDIISGGRQDDTLSGGDGIDMIQGDIGDDKIDGDAGDDVLLGGIGDDVVFGGDGNDNINGGNQQDVLFGDAGDDMIAGGAGNDNLFGGTGNDMLFGNSGADDLSGQDGKRYLVRR